MRQCIHTRTHGRLTLFSNVTLAHTRIVSRASVLFVNMSDASKQEAAASVSCATTIMFCCNSVVLDTMLVLAPSWPVLCFSNLVLCVANAFPWAACRDSAFSEASWSPVHTSKSTLRLYCSPCLSSSAGYPWSFPAWVFSLKMNCLESPIFANRKTIERMTWQDHDASKRGGIAASPWRIAISSVCRPSMPGAVAADPRRLGRWAGWMWAEIALASRTVALCVEIRNLAVSGWRCAWCLACLSVRFWLNRIPVSYGLWHVVVSRAEWQPMYTDISYCASWWTSDMLLVSSAVLLSIISHQHTLHTCTSNLPSKQLVTSGIRHIFTGCSSRKLTAWMTAP